MNLTEKKDFMENILTKTHEVPTKSMIPKPIPTIPQLCMKPPTTRHVSKHHTDPRPITEASTDMYGMDGLIVAHQKQPIWKKIVQHQLRTMMEEETAMTGVRAKRSLHALSGKSAIGVEDR